jgi:hypothetical protein
MIAVSPDVRSGDALDLAGFFLTFCLREMLARGDVLRSIRSVFAAIAFGEAQFADKLKRLSVLVQR